MTEGRQSGEESSGDDSTPPTFNPTEASANNDPHNMNGNGNVNVNGNEDGLKTEEVQDNLNNENEEDESESTSPLDESLPEIEISQSGTFRVLAFALVFLIVAVSIGCAFAWDQIADSNSIKFRMEHIKQRLLQLLDPSVNED